MRFKLFILAISGSFLLVHGRRSLGRASASRKRAMKRSQAFFMVNDMEKQKSLSEDDMIDIRFLEETSMSMSAAPTVAAVQPAKSPGPSIFSTNPPSPAPSPESSTEPTSIPPISPAPTTSSPSMQPTSMAPSSTPSASLSMIPSLKVDPAFTFECTTNGHVTLGDNKDINTTAIFLFLGFLVESSSSSTDDFLEELEDTLLETAVTAALGCTDHEERRNRVLQERSRKLLLTQSIIVDSTSCEPTISEAQSCHIIETDLVFFLKGEFDPDRVAYSAYSAIEKKMTGGNYIGVGGSVLKVQYLSPLPLPIPPQLLGDLGNDGTVLISSNDKELIVSPWTIGACIASVFGGVVSLFVWKRNRRSRQTRHVELIEDTSFMDTATRNPVSI